MGPINCSSSSDLNSICTTIFSDVENRVRISVKSYLQIKPRVENLKNYDFD